MRDPASPTSRPLWPFILGAWTTYGVVHGVLWTMAHEEPSQAYRWTIPCALVVAWTWAAFTPVIFRLARVLAPSRRGWAVSIVGHTVAALLVALAMSWVRREAIAASSDFTRDPFWPVFVWWLDVWAFIYITLVVIGRALDLRRRYADRTMRADLLEAQLARTQLKYLESQLQPHFLFNALNTIQELAHEAPAAAERMLQRLRALLTLSLERSGQDEVTLAEELAALEPYLDIQRTRFSNWLTVDVDVPDEWRGVRVPHLILQPLVENAIRHGVSVRQAPGHVLVSARPAGTDRLVLRVEDNGVGLRGAGSSGGGGIGLSNVVDRLRQLYGADYRFEMHERAEGGVCVEFEVPLGAPGPAGDGSVARQAEAPAPDVDLDPTGPDWRTGEFAAAAPAVQVQPATGSPAVSMRVWLGITGVWLLLAVFWTNQLVLFRNVAPSAVEMDIFSIARLQLGGSACWLLMSLPVLWLAQRFRFTPDNWPSRLPVHVAGALGAGFFHLVGLRVMGLSEMPVLAYTNLNPLTGDFFIYLAFLAWSHSRDFVAWFRAREIETARLSASIARSRFQALRVQLRPAFVLATLEFLERLVHTDAERAERLITRLADTLRLTLEVGRRGTTSVARELELAAACIEAHRLGVRPGVSLEQHVDPRCLDDEIPSRLLCAMLDELLANVWVAADRPLAVEFDVARVSENTQVTIRARGEGMARSGVSHAWWHRHGIAERAVENAGTSVSVLVPDMTSVMLMIEPPVPRSRGALALLPRDQEVILATT